MEPTMDFMGSTMDFMEPTEDLMEPTEDLMEPTEDFMGSTMDFMEPTEDLMQPTMDLTSDLYVMGNSTLSFWDSLKYCRNLGMHFASIHGDAENAEADAACTADYCWIGASGSRGIFNWTDGTKMNYTNWFYDIPDREGCVHMHYSGAWTDIDCDHSFYPLCRKTDSSSSTPEATTNSPETTITTVEPTAMFVTGTELMTFDESDAYCKSLGMELASIHNDADNAAVHAACSDGYIYNWCWIGGTCQNRQQFNYTWTDGSDWSYTKWNSGEPNNFNNDDEDCVHMRDDGGWNDRPCDTALIPICGYSLDRMNSSVSLSMEPTLQPTMDPISGSPSTETMNTSSTSAPSTAP